MALTKTASGGWAGRWGCNGGQHQRWVGINPTLCHSYPIRPHQLFRQSFKVMSWSSYINMSNGICLSWRVAIWKGITWALFESILTEDLAWSWLQMPQCSGLTDSVFFLLCEPIKFPLQISTFKIPYNTWHLETFLAIVEGFLYLEN